MLTKQDSKLIEKLFEKNNKYLEAILDLKLDERFKEVNEKIGHLPTKDEFYKMMDKMFGEQETIRNEQTLLSNSQADHEKRINKLETFVTAS